MEDMQAKWNAVFTEYVDKSVAKILQALTELSHEEILLCEKNVIVSGGKRVLNEVVTQLNHELERKGATHLIIRTATDSHSSGRIVLQWRLDYEGKIKA